MARARMEVYMAEPDAYSYVPVSAALFRRAVAAYDDVYRAGLAARGLEDVGVHLVEVSWSRERDEDGFPWLHLLANDGTQWYLRESTTADDRVVVDAARDFADDVLDSIR